MSAPSRMLSPLPKRQRLLEQHVMPAPIPRAASSLSSEEAANSPRFRKKNDQDDQVEENEIEDHHHVDNIDATSVDHEYREGEAGYQGLSSSDNRRIHPPDETDDRSNDASTLDQLFLKAESLFGQSGIEAMRSCKDELKGLFRGLTPIPTAALRTSQEYDNSEPDEEGYYNSKARSHATGHAGHSFCDDGLGNKKKRKIPGMTNGRRKSEDVHEFSARSKSNLAEEVYQLADQAEPVQTYVNDLAIKAPAHDLPKTAKAALAKLNRPKFRRSFDPLTTLSRRYAHKQFRLCVYRHSPLALAAIPVYSIPRSFTTGPPPLPPSCLLKGSKAVKFAMKLMKDREKENVRVRILLGKVTLPVSFWDEKKFERAKVERGFRVKSGLLTPPRSCSSDEAGSPLSDASSATSFRASPPTLDTFMFTSPPSDRIWLRWTAVLGRIQGMLIAKEKALRQTKEEMELKLERAREALKEEHQALQKRKDRKNRASSPASTSSALMNSEGHSGATTVSQSKPSQATATAPSPPLPLASSTPPATSASSTPSIVPPARKQPMKGRRKRAMHANSLNSHHRDNYVPSRAPVLTVHTPSSHSFNGHTSDPLTSWPASAEAIANRHPSRYVGDFFGTADEYTCAWCDYDILFGDSSKAIKKRKKLLKIRKSAADRAASTVAGSNISPEAESDT